MLVSVVIVYHFFKSYLFPTNGKKDAVYCRIPELQKIFTNCPSGTDLKIRTSVFIEAISLNYDLNDELKCELVRKLDPDNVDLNYSKEELFIIFKDWISSAPSRVRFTEDPFHSTPHLPYTSTPREHCGELLRNRFTRTKLFEHVSDFSPDKSRNDVTDGSHNSSSTKKKLIHHQASLRKNIENYEMIASSLERKYGDVKNMCALQKLEIERLKQELKICHETEQMMEEMSEQRRKQEMETERKYAKAQSRVEDLEVLVANLKQDNENQVSELAQMVEKDRKQEAELKSLWYDLAEKEMLNQELQNRVNTAEMLTLEKEQMLASVLKRNDALTNENYDLHRSISVLHMPRAPSGGIPLCDELPSEMIQFPVGACAAGDLSPFVTPISPLPYLVSTSCQSDMPPSSCSTNNCVTSSCQTEGVALSWEIKRPPESTSSQTEVVATSSTYSQTFRTNAVCSQTEPSQFNVNSSQTEHDFGMSPACTQIEVLKTCLAFTQTETFSVQSQTESCVSLSKFCQTESCETTSSSTQTNPNRKLTVSSQTDLRDFMINFTQTELELSSSYPQTEFLNCFPQQTESSLSPRLNRRIQLSNGCSPTYTFTDSFWSSQTSHSFSLLRFVELILSFLSYFPRVKTVRRFSYWCMYRGLVLLVSILVAFFAVFFTFYIVCQNNGCQLELRYPHGSPPV